MVEFVTVKENTLNFGEDCFIEVASEVAKTDDGDKRFINITRGYYKANKEKRYMKAISFPDIGNIAAEVAAQILLYTKDWDKEEVE